MHKSELAAKHKKLRRTLRAIEFYENKNKTWLSLGVRSVAILSDRILNGMDSKLATNDEIENALIMKDLNEIHDYSRPRIIQNSLTPEIVSIILDFLKPNDHTFDTLHRLMLKFDNILFDLAWYSRDCFGAARPPVAFDALRRIEKEYPDTTRIMLDYKRWKESGLDKDEDADDAEKSVGLHLGLFGRSTFTCRMH